MVHLELSTVVAASAIVVPNYQPALGGISYPLLADFHPKGAVGVKYGVYLEERGLDRRSTVIIDKQGIVCHTQIVEPGGIRKAEDLLDECQKVNTG